MTYHSRIRSFGMSVPDRIMTNADLECLMDTSDEWIQQRSGIRERRWISPGETLLGMAAKSARDALNKGQLTVDDIDMVLFSGLLGDWIFPGTGCHLQKELGFKHTVPALDIRNQCSGFLYALHIADGWIRSGLQKRILIVAAEIHSTSLEVSTRGRDLAVLFGDGAASCIVERSEEAAGSRILRTHLAAEGEHADKLCLKYPTPNTHPRICEGVPFGSEAYPYMDGRTVFKHAVTRMCESLTENVGALGLKFSDLDFLIAHQANLRINHMVMNQLGLPLEKTHSTIERYGNTTSATIPLTMNEAVDQGKIKRGDTVALVAFGSGFTWGSIILKY